MVPKEISLIFTLKTYLYQHVLSNDSSYLGEGLISIEECKKVLNSFPLNKVPGNDGLPVEFNKTFWDLAGDPFVKSFN